MESKNETYELTSLQKGMLAHSIGAPRTGTYIVQPVYEFNDLCIQSLEYALNKVINHHDILRASFYPEDPVPYLEIQTEVSVTINVYDWSEHNSVFKQQSLLKDFLRSDREIDFDYANPPLIRPSAIRLKGEKSLFIFTHHHILLDGLSSPIVSKQIIRAYRSKKAGLSDVIFEKVPSYTTFLTWLAQRDLSKDHAFWASYLKDFRPKGTLPMEANKQVSINAEAFSKWSSTLPASSTLLVENLASNLGVTKSSVFVAALMFICSEYLSSSDCVIGLLFNGRPVEIPDSDRMVGMFMNTLPLRVQLDDSCTVESLITTVHRSQLAISEHQHVSLNYVSQLCASPPDKQLINIILDYKVSFAGPQENVRNNLSQVQSSGISKSDSTSMAIQSVPLHFNLESVDGNLEFTVTFSSTKIDADLVPSFCRSYAHVLEEFCLNANQPIAGIDILTEADYQRLDSISHGLPLKLDHSRVVHNLFVLQAQKTPDSEAVLYLRENYSYSELFRKSLSLASKLSGLGIGLGNTVAFKFDRTHLVAPLTLAVFFVGANYVPLDPSWPHERVLQVLEDAQVDLICTDDTLGDTIISPIITLSELFNELDSHPPLELSLINCNLDTVAYTLYTSGSTGRPKPITITHRVLASRILSDQFLLKVNEVIVSKTAFSFVDFLWELFLPLVNGHQCHIVPTPACRDPLQLVSYLSPLSTHRIVLVPSLLAVILDLPPESISQLSHIEYWFSTGEPLSATLAHRFYSLFPKAKLFNLYGSSEAWDISCWPVPSDITENSLILAGKPMPNTSIFVLNEQGRLSPPGTVGTIAVGGEHLFQGYANKNTMVPLPTISINGNKHSYWLSGDKGYVHKSGDLALLGRSDSLIKVRGFRVDLNDLESVGKQHKSVKDFVASHIDSSHIAASVLVKSQNMDIEPIKKYLRDRVPAYMMPSEWRLYTNFPTLSSGKVDRKSLKAAFRSNTDVPTCRHETLLSDTETLLLSTTKDILKNSSLTIDSNFFESGGHSLAAVRLLSRLSKELSKTITLDTIFSYPVLSELASFIEYINATSNSLVSRTDYSGLAPASLPQRRLWIVDSLSTAKNTYILTTLVRAPEVKDLSLLSDALRHLLARHSILRTYFVNVDGEPFQQLDEVFEPRIESIVVSDRTRDHEILASIDADSQWDLTQAPLFRLYFIEAPDNANKLLLKIHHIISDGISLRIFFEDLLSIYRSLLESGSPYKDLPNLPIQYRDYSIWQYDYSSTTNYSSHLKFWSDLLSSRGTQLEFLTDRSSVADISHSESVTLSSSLGPRALTRLRALARIQKTTLFNVLLSIFGIYISRHVGSNEVNIGSPVTGRTRDELQKLIGFFVNLTLYPLTIDENQTLDDLLMSVTSLSRDILRHQDIQFDDIVGHIAPERDSYGQPLFQVMIVHEVAIESHTPVDIPLSRSAFSTDRSNYDYLLLVREHEAYLELTHHVRASIFSMPRLRSMVRRLNTLFARLSKSPDIPISSVSMLPQDQWNRYVSQWNSTDLPNPFEGQTVSSIFSNLATHNPHHPCIYDNGTLWNRGDILSLSRTYQQIIASENLPLNHPVALLLPKSARQVAVILALNSLGHSFVPIDPSSPLKRIQSITKSVSTRIVVTDNSTTALASSLEGVKAFELPKLIYTSTRDADNATVFPIVSNPNDTCYICFTSGSTGLPKGVQVSNRNIVSLFHAHSQFFLLATESRVLSTLGFYFDAGIGEQIRTILSGSTLYFCGDKVLNDPDRLVSLLLEHRITHVGIPPSVLQGLDPLVSPGLKDLKVLVTAGESLPIVTAKTWGMNRSIITGHGATETTVGDTIAVNWNLSTKPPLGRPLPNMKAFILDRYLQPCPPYVIGELAISGPQVSKGYVSDPARTALSFRNSLPSISSNYPFYLTGDFAYTDRSGVLYFSSRRDSQTKIRGHRIDTSEIEAAALSVPDVRQAVCLPLQIGNTRQLILYYISDNISGDDLLLSLGKILPSFMVPYQAIPIDVIPTTPNGKLDQDRLSKIKAQSVEEPYSAPATPLQTTLHDIWCSTLNIDKVSIDSGFFQIGGDSIQAVHLLTKCRKSGIILGPTDLFEHQTIRSLARHLESLQDRTVVNS